jgi:hypothetical protein
VFHLFYYIPKFSSLVLICFEVAAKNMLASEAKAKGVNQNEAPEGGQEAGAAPAAARQTRRRNKITN